MKYSYLSSCLPGIFNGVLYFGRNVAQSSRGVHGEEIWFFHGGKSLIKKQAML